MDDDEPAIDVVPEAAAMTPADLRASVARMLRDRAKELRIRSVMRFAECAAVFWSSPREAARLARLAVQEQIAAYECEAEAFLWDGKRNAPPADLPEGKPEGEG